MNLEDLAALLRNCSYDLYFTCGQTGGRVEISLFVLDFKPWNGHFVDGRSPSGVDV